MVNEKIKAAEENLIHVYNRFPIALERGEGVYLYDTTGKNIWILQPDLQCRDWDTEIRS